MIDRVAPDDAEQPTGRQDTADDDRALASSAKTDPAAFGVLFERYGAAVYRYCYLRLRSREAAEDATSEVFLRALAGVPGYRGGRFAAWLFRITRNVTINATRRRHAEPIDALPELPDTAPSPEDEVVSRAEQVAARAAVAALPGEHRLAVELWLAGWSDDQIGAVLGKRRNAVHKLRVRALGRVRRMLEADETNGSRGG